MSCPDVVDDTGCNMYFVFVQIIQYRLHFDCFEKGGDVWLDEERQTDKDDMDREVKQGQKGGKETLG